jgi:hypothetical protein
MRMRKTSSLVRLNKPANETHSWYWKGTLSMITGYAYSNGLVVLDEGRDMFTLGTIATGGNMNPSGNLFCKKIYLVGWM